MVSIRGKKSRTDVDQFDQGDLILAMEKLQEVQDELEKINEEANRKILEIEQKYNKVKEPVYVRRNEIISSIPDFWLTSFLNHPTLGNLLNEEDQKIFKYMYSLHVDHFKDLRKGYCITFHFKTNPYFENTKLTKTIKFLDNGTLKSVGTTIKWKESKTPADGSEKKGNKRSLHLNSSFFTWFGTRSEYILDVDQDVVAELIKEDLWPNPIEHLNNEEDEDDTQDDEDDDEDEEDEEEDEDDEQDCDGKDDA